MFCKNAPQPVKSLTAILLKGAKISTILERELKICQTVVKNHKHTYHLLCVIYTTSAKLRPPKYFILHTSVGLLEFPS